MLDRIKGFDGKSERNKRINYYIVYTIIFLMMVPLVYHHFWGNGKSLVRSGDALTQHFPVMTYYAKILRQTISSLVSGNGLQLPLWSFSIGPGADIITNLNYYGVGDPLSLLAIFFPLSKMELGYTFLILLRLYLAGVSFSAYCKEMGRGRWNTLCGAFAYIFCGYIIFAGVRHPFFINPMIILPLLLIGIERIFKKKKPYVFVLAVLYAAITGVYFFYMMGILSVLYVIVRGWSFCKDNKLKEWLTYLGKFVGYFVVGVLLSAIVFIPNIIALLGSTRMQSEPIVETFYGDEYYWNAPIKFLSSGSLGNWTFLGYAALIAIAIFMMFSYRRQNTQLKIGFIILTIIFILPYAGHVMNGFSYVSNRWVWGYSFLLAFILTTMLPKIVQIKGKRFLALLVSAVIYLAYAYWVLFDENETQGIRNSSELAITQYYIAIGVVIIAFIWARFVRKKESPNGAKARQTVIKIALLLTILVNVFLQADWYYSAQGVNYVAEFCPIGTPYERQTEVANVVNSIGDTSDFYRYNENAYDKGQLNNSALISQLYSNSLYYSIVDKNYLEYMEEISCNDIIASGHIRGLDSRTSLNTLAGTKYYITETNKKNYAPYCYTELFENGRFSAFENENYLPLGYTYQNYITRIEFEKLNAVQKEQAMLQGVVLDNSVANLSAIMPKETAQKRDFKLQCKRGVTLEDGKFVVTKKKAEVVVTFEGMTGSETYVGINGFSFHAQEGEEQIKTKISVGIDSSGQVNKRIEIRTPYDSYYVGRHNFVTNMGYSEGAKNKFVITFPEKGEYTFDEMSIICQPMDEYVTQVNRLKEEVLENVVIGTNKVNGTIDLVDTKFLCLSIPYSEGWSLYVDGEERELLRANTAYMGVELEAGHHEIELQYFTPYLKMSIACTFLGVILFASIVFINKRKNRQNES